MYKNVQKWLEKGIIDEHTADLINQDIKEEKEKNRRLRVNITLYTVASILIGIGVISFIAANDWILKLFKDIKLLKIFLMVILSTASLYGGYKLSEEGTTYKKLGTFLIMLSAFLIGGTYAVTGQTYNINSGGSVIYLLWFISILPLAYIYRNCVINGLSVILLIVFTILKYMEIGIDKGLTWTIFMPVFLGLLLYSLGNFPVIVKKYADFSLQYKVVGLGAVFITLLILTVSVETSYQITSPYYILPVCFVLVWGLFNYFYSEDKENPLIITETIFTLFLSVLLLVLITANEVTPAVIMILSHFALISMIVFCFHYGYKEEKERIVALANQFLTIYIAVIYCRWGWNYMDKTAFFLIGGIVLLSTGIYLERKRRELKSNNLKRGSNNE